MGVFIVIFLVVVIAGTLLIYRISSAAGSHMKLMGEAAHRQYLELYIRGIKRKDSGEMESAISFMILYCPHSCSECNRTRGCPKCSSLYGWRSDLISKYGKVVTVDDLSKATEEAI